MGFTNGEKNVSQLNISHPKSEIVTESREDIKTTNACYFEELFDKNMGNSVNSYEMSVSQDEISSNYLGDWDTPDSLNSHSEPTTLTPAIQPPHLGGYPRNGGTAPFKELSPVSLRTRSKIAVKGNTANSSVSVVGGNVRRTPPPPATSLSASSSSDFSDDSSLSPAYAKGASKGASQSSPFSYDCDYNNTVLKTVR